MQEVTVVLPLYTAALSAQEWAAIDQCCTVLAAHPLTVVAPRSLDLGFITSVYPQVRIERFADDYFASVHDYNRLMLSSAFYERFQAYRYMLIHQTDASVFRDELAHWCALDFDYIGAPWTPNQMRYASGAGRAALWCKRWYYLLAGRFSNRLLLYRVGNGGFSLRRVAKFAEITRAHSARIAEFLAQDGTEFNEDVFFGYEMNKWTRRISVPSYRQALAFAFEQNPALALAQNGAALPFGCHAWNKPAFAGFWRSYIASA